ncbi:MAG: 2-oxoacid:acceptor oxidoreductase subunit alpha [Candidatus Bathyarchaeota archaeon]|nr:MAG: 2-oxoacid:acceptor oxidoreductase subunit alpha [Candidatus Bathyarchaeota archaeon]
MSRKVLTGSYFVHGDWACAEGALAAGCKFYAAYPITPASEIAERMAVRLPQVGGAFIQFEDELGAMAAVVGASYAGKKAMTATSGPGFSLMQENIGLAIMTEAPCVVVDVMRGAPSTGQPTKAGQGEMMQVRWGSHGDYEIISLVPSSVQETFDLTVEAFNRSERYRIPTFVMVDGILGHMYERIEIPEPEEIDIVNRKKPTQTPEEYLPFKADEDLIPPMANFGDGYHFYSTGLTHDERGYPDMSIEVQDKLIRRLSDKIRRNEEKIIRIEEVDVEDAEILVVAYGIPSRSALKAVEQARAEGIRAGLLRLITAWPFPTRILEDLSSQLDAVIMLEMNYGQLVREVERAVKPTPVTFLPKLGEEPHKPDEILTAIRRCSG